MILKLNERFSQRIQVDNLYVKYNGRDYQIEDERGKVKESGFSTDEDAIERAKAIQGIEEESMKLKEAYELEKDAYNYVINAFEGVNNLDTLSDAVRNVYNHFNGGARIDFGRHSVTADGWMPDGNGDHYTFYNSFDLNYLKGDVRRFAEDVAMAVHGKKEFSYTPDLAKAMKNEGCGSKTESDEIDDGGVEKEVDEAYDNKFGSNSYKADAFDNACDCINRGYGKEYWIKKFKYANSSMMDDIWDSATDYMTESVNLDEAKKPKYWNSRFAVNVLDAYDEGELTYDNIKEWDKKYNGGVDPNPAFNTKEILDYYTSGHDIRKESLTESPLATFQPSDDSYDYYAVIDPVKDTLVGMSDICTSLEEAEVVKNEHEEGVIYAMVPAEDVQFESKKLKESSDPDLMYIKKLLSSIINDNLNLFRDKESYTYEQMSAIKAFADYVKRDFYALLDKLDVDDEMTIESMKLKESWSDSVTTQDLQSVISTLEDIVDSMDAEEVEELRLSPNTYGLSHFISFPSRGFLDLTDWERFFSNGEDEEYEGLKLKTEAWDDQKVNYYPFREFTQQDYYGYGGAEKMPDGSEPLIYNGNNCDILICGTEDGGISVDVYMYEDTPDGQESAYSSNANASTESIKVLSDAIALARKAVMADKKGSDALIEFCESNLESY